MDFLQKNLANVRGQASNDQLTLLSWSLGFYILENFESEVNLEAIILLIRQTTFATTPSKRLDEISLA